MRSRQSVLRSSAIASAKEGISLEGYGHRGRKDDPLYRARKLLIRGDERLDERGREKLMEALRRGDPFDEVLGAWLAKEACRSICMEDDADAAAAARAGGFRTAVPDRSVQRFRSFRTPDSSERTRSTGVR